MEIMFDTSTARGKVSGTDLSADTYSSIINTHGNKGGIFWLKVTAVSSADTVDVTLEGYDQLTGDWTALSAAIGGDRAYAFAQVSATGSDQLTVYPGLTGVNNQTINGVLPEIIRAKADVTGTDVNIDLTLAVELIK